MLNDIFASELADKGIKFEREYKCIPGRKFAYDFMIGNGSGKPLLIELQGGTFMKRGGHNTGLSIRRDCEKGNLATIAGYDIMHFTTQDVEDGTAIEMVQKYLGGKVEK